MGPSSLRALLMPEISAPGRPQHTWQRSLRRWMRRPGPTSPPRVAPPPTAPSSWAGGRSSSAGTRARPSTGSWRTTWATPSTWSPPTRRSERGQGLGPRSWPTRWSPSFWLIRYNQKSDGSFNLSVWTYRMPSAATPQRTLTLWRQSGSTGRLRRRE